MSLLTIISELCKRQVEGSIFNPIAGVNGETVNGSTRPSLHRYTGFPWVDGLSDGTVVSGYKESANHVAAGPFMFGTSGGGLSFSYSQINVPGYGLVSCSNLSLKVLPGDKILITWQTDAETSQLFAAYSTNKGVTWTYIGGLTYHTAANVGAGTGYYAAQYGKPLVFPSGKIWQFVYDAPVSGTGDQHGYFVEINAALTTLSIGPTVSTQTGAAFPNGYHSEGLPIMVENTGVDATCKIVVIQRNETYEAFTHYRSTGGATGTWTRNDSYLLNIFWTTAIEKFPISDYVLRGSLFYLIVGIRNTGDYFGAYSSITATDLWNNTSTGYNALVRFIDYYADTNAAAIDCGYPTAIDRQFTGINEILTQSYDSNPGWSGAGEKEERIVQKTITFS